MTCRVCRWQRVWRRHLCEACWMYEYRTGRRRPEALIVKHARRVLERAR